jgi:type IV secretion system protein VirB6
MGFFAEFSVWLNALLASFIGTKTAAVAAAIEPALMALVAIYIMGWGYLQVTGQIEEPLFEGLKRIARVALVIGIGLRLWLYNSLIVSTFFTAPGQLAAVIIGAPDSVTIVDQIILNGGDTASALMEKGGILDGNFAYYLAGFFVYIAVGLAAIYTIFLLSLAKIALSILLALGPLFIATLLFNVSRRFFDAWIAQLSNYALLAVLTTLAVALLMQLLTTSTTQAAALGSGISIAEGMRVCFASALIFLVLRQVMPMAGGLAGGMALSTYSSVSRSFQWLGRQVVNPRLRTRL